MTNTQEYYCFENKTYGNEFFAQLNAFRKAGVFCDQILVSADGIEFHVHRSVLAAGCLYFNAMFEINMAEKQQTRVNLKTVSSSALSEILEYIYTGTLRVTKHSVAEMIVASGMFLLFDLTEYCWSIFPKTLDLENCISRKILADALSSPTIAKTVTSFVLKNFVDLDSVSLVQCPVTFLNEVLSSRELVVNCEIEVLGVFLKWFNSLYFELADAKKICEELLDHVRFKFIKLKSEEMRDFLRSFGISEEHWLFGLVLERFERKSGCTEARLSYKEIDVVMVVGGQGERTVFNQMCAYVPDIDQWCELTPMNQPRKSFGLVSTETALLAVGGTMEKFAGSPVSFIERYDARTDTWEELNMTSSSDLERDNAGIIGLNDHIVISGGHSLASGAVTSSVVELDPCNGARRELTPLHTAREGHVAVVNDDSMYVIGGKNQAGYLASVERFDKASETWNILAPMNNSRSDACAVWYNNNLYVFGGYDGQNVLNSVEVYDPVLDRWQLLSAGMATPRMRFTVCVCANHAYVIGGMAGSRGPMTSDVEKYSFVDSTWSSVSSLDESKMELCACKLSMPHNVLRLTA